jgi:cell division protein FtsI (penicillin-binding protein 3)
MAATNKRELILSRSLIVFIVLSCFACLAFARILYLQTLARKKWQTMLDQTKTERTIKPIPSLRGNIFAADGSLLATTVPYYMLSIDPQVSDSAYFHKNIDQFCIGIANITHEKTPGEYKGIILKAKLDGYVLKKKIAQIQSQIKKAKDDDKKIKALTDQIEDIKMNQLVQYIKLNQVRITHQDLLKVKTLPFCWENSKTKERGLMKEDILIREHPFKSMARRTIGNDDSTGHYGIETKFHKALYGKYGEGLRKKIGPKVWVPVDDKPYQMPVNGMDVYTTLDMNFQDITEVALKKQLIASNAENGCAIIMDIKTGNVKSMVNLGLDKDGQYQEDLNYAVKDALGDPGSTFKLASLMAVIDDFDLSLNTFAADCNGSIGQGGSELKCTHAHGSQTIQQIFENSCNVGVYSLVKKYYNVPDKNRAFKNSPDRYLELIRKTFKLNDKVISDHLGGEPAPNIKNRSNAKWSGMSLSRMSIGYEIDITPLQMLTFYNAVANDGVWVKPRLVSSVMREDGEEHLKIPFYSENMGIKKETIAKLKLMMEGVVKNGTAKNVGDGVCKIAGKTGTAFRIIDGQYTQSNQSVSFIGYFPADNPRYSCAVTIKGVKQNANTVSAPVFREIADRIYAYDVSMHEGVALKTNGQNISQNTKKGLTNDYQTLGKSLTMSIPNGKGIAKTQPGGTWEAQTVKNNKMPDLRGMSLRDALFVLENIGFKVNFSGFGKVIQQSIEPNATIIKRQTVSLVLN